MLRPLTSLMGVLLVLAGCGVPGEGPCNPADPQHPTALSRCETGSGAFGVWTLDAGDLPAYRYTLPEDTSPIASWWNTEGRHRTDHWHQIGNGALVALAFNEGPVQVLDLHRAPLWLNDVAEADGHYGGGFSYIEEGHRTWSTAYRWRPPGARFDRVFGMGYVETRVDYDGLEVDRTVLAPRESLPALLSRVRLTNGSARPRRLTLYEYWDVNLQPLLPAPIASGLVNPGYPAEIDRDRSAWMAHYDQRAELRTDWNAAVVSTAIRPGAVDLPPAGTPLPYDPNPSPLFLAALTPGAPGRFYVDRAGFFGPGGPTHPSVLGPPLVGPVERPGAGQPLVLVHGAPIDLAPGASVTVRYAFGLLRDGVETALASWRDEADPLEDLRTAWRGRLLYFAPDRDPFLQRELAWDSYYLLSASAPSDYFRAHRIVQGGAYLYRQGFDGAARDFLLFALPATYLDPDLARESLRTVMEMTQTDGQIAYAIAGDGMLFGAPIHAVPSDADLFFLWALSEYLEATRDFAFLKDPVAFYSDQGLPDVTQATVLDHVRVAVDHLLDGVGTGPHGLVRLGDGDWNDGIAYFAQDPSHLLAQGESGFDTALALFVLPMVEGWLEGWDAAAAARLQSALPPLRAAFAASWQGRWFLRGWDGSGHPIGQDRLFLEPQSLAILAGAAPDPAGLLRTIQDELVAPSPLGALILSEPKGGLPLAPGTDVNGGIWAAMNGILTWAQGVVAPELGWQGLKQNTLANHARYSPTLWYGIWSGPDAYNAPRSARPGETFAHLATPGTDFPIMNANQHALPLLALLKLAGIEPTPQGLRLAPRLPLARWSLETPLVGVRWSPEAVSGDYKARATGRLRLEVQVPWPSATVTVDGAAVPAEWTGSAQAFDLPIEAGRTTGWTVTPRP